MFNKTVSTLVAVALASATIVAAGGPSGNPTIKPEVGEIVPVNAPYTIKWKPETPGTVSLHLLRGSSDHMNKIATIVQGIPNSGSYSWTPSVTLEDDTSRYGINLTVDGSSQYQYTPQFGISNPTKRNSNTASTQTGQSGSGSVSSSVVPNATSSSSAGTTATVVVETFVTSNIALETSSAESVSSSVPVQASSSTTSATKASGSTATKATQSSDAGKRGLAGGLALLVLAVTGLVSL